MPKCPDVPWVGMTEKRKYGKVPVLMGPKKNPMAPGYQSYSWISQDWRSVKVNNKGEIDYSEKCGADWDVAIKGFLMDSRIGQSHYQVPGPDGKLGFGGHCLPKDINALKSFGESLGLNLNTLNGVINTNLEVRPEKDWESDSRAFTSNQIEIPFKN